MHAHLVVSLAHDEENLQGTLHQFKVVEITVRVCQFPIVHSLKDKGKAILGMISVTDRLLTAS